MPTHPLTETLEQWVVAHICDTYPDLTQDQRKAIYRGSAALRQGYALMKAAEAIGDTRALQSAARETYLAWVVALKSATMVQEARSSQKGVETPPGKKVAPAPEESPFRRYHSADLDADILLCKSAQDAKPYWEDPTRGVAYIPQELTILRTLKAHYPETFGEHLKHLHHQKLVFGGSLMRLELPQKHLDIPEKIL